MHIFNQNLDFFQLIWSIVLLFLFNSASLEQVKNKCFHHERAEKSSSSSWIVLVFALDIIIIIFIFNQKMTKSPSSSSSSQKRNTIANGNIVFNNLSYLLMLLFLPKWLKFLSYALPVYLTISLTRALYLYLVGSIGDDYVKISIKIITGIRT